VRGERRVARITRASLRASPKMQLGDSSGTDERAMAAANSAAFRGHFASYSARRFTASRRASNALPKPREVSQPAFTSLTRQHLPTLQPADTPSRERQRQRQRERGALYRSEDYALPPSPPLSQLAVNVDTSWRDIPKLFNWDLLDGTLPNALPASSRIHRELQDPKPRGTRCSARGNKLDLSKGRLRHRPVIPRVCLSAILAATLSNINWLCDQRGSPGNVP